MQFANKKPCKVLASKFGENSYSNPFWVNFWSKWITITIGWTQITWIFVVSTEKSFYRKQLLGHSLGHLIATCELYKMVHYVPIDMQSRAVPMENKFPQKCKFLKNSSVFFIQMYHLPNWFLHKIYFFDRATNLPSMAICNEGSSNGPSGTIL